MLNQFSRTELLLGKEAMLRLQKSHIAVFGIGGVGTYVVEGLARCGVGRLTLTDTDKVCVTNINRQIIATSKTIGKYKADLMAERILEINPQAEVKVRNCFFSADNASEFDFSSFDYVVDAIDTVTSKLIIIEKAKAAGVPVISCMGTGNKLDPTMLQVSDISKTSVCPLARVMRRELRMRGIASLKVVYSKEPAIKPEADEQKQVLENESSAKRQIPGSVSFVPSVAGMIIAGEVIKNLIKEC